MEPMLSGDLFLMDTFDTPQNQLVIVPFTTSEEILQCIDHMHPGERGKYPWPAVPHRQLPAGTPVHEITYLQGVFYRYKTYYLVHAMEGPAYRISTISTDLTAIPPSEPLTPRVERPITWQIVKASRGAQ